VFYKVFVLLLLLDDIKSSIEYLVCKTEHKLYKYNPIIDIMENITLGEIYRSLMDLRREMFEIKIILKEKNLELADDVVGEIENSRRRPLNTFVSHEEMTKEFG